MSKLPRQSFRFVPPDRAKSTRGSYRDLTSFSSDEDDGPTYKMPEALVEVQLLRTRIVAHGMRLVEIVRMRYSR